MQSPLPTYSIYGEHGRTMDVDWLHCESIAERSRLHDWEIGAHRHELLVQLFWIEKGRCGLSLDGQEQQVQGPCVLLVPPPVVHGFHFEPRLQGQVVTVLAQHLSKLLAEEPALERRLLQPRVQPLDAAQAAAVGAAFRALREEFRSAGDWRSLGVDSALLRLLVTLARNLPEPPAAAGSRQGARGLQHVRRYRALVEERFRQQPPVSALAREIGITTTQLNRVCQAALGCSSMAVLHARLVLEAQRELAYTTMSIKQIAHDLGFADAAYFTRFYQGRTGLSPSQWRSACGKGLAAV
ncbi:helix-turn-helix domain-containing protein [Pelomonas sp. KK5]|uniref:helix-turn-helix domain-containing protein n=1 Tax=Pelomonas sp. KK5 TaxID=1855730 RepID=UPI00097C5935|nr:helix-turn-helix domain-containing protein [Pelomonas sp. KK5]